MRILIDIKVIDHPLIEPKKIGKFSTWVPWQGRVRTSSSIFSELTLGHHYGRMLLFSFMPLLLMAYLVIISMSLFSFFILNKVFPAFFSINWSIHFLYIKIYTPNLLHHVHNNPASQGWNNILSGGGFKEIFTSNFYHFFTTSFYLDGVLKVCSWDFSSGCAVIPTHARIL